MTERLEGGTPMLHPDYLRGTGAWRVLQAWGPWVDGGGWLHIGGSAVDRIYRYLDRVRKSWDDAQAGSYDFHFQIGHPLGVPDFLYAGELALGVVLADPSGEFSMQFIANIVM